MGKDMCVPCDGGVVNIRVGAIIQKAGRVLMVRDAHTDYYYSVGGRIQFGETAEEAVVREVWEETGARLEIDHLGFVEENYFIGDTPSRLGKVYYELGFFFYMKTPEDFEPVQRSFTEGELREYLAWIAPDEPRMIYPDFFRTELDAADRSVKFRTKDDRFFLRKMTPADGEDLHRVLSDPEVMRYLEPPFSRERTERFLREEGLCEPPRILAVEDGRHRFAGYAIYHPYDEDSMEIGWVLAKEAWGKGLASLLTKQLVVKAQLEGKDTVLECLPGQAATRRIAEKFGYVRAGTRDGLEIYRKSREEEE